MNGPFMHIYDSSVKRLVLNSRRIPWDMHSAASMSDTGFEARIIPISLSKSSTNLKIRYTINAGIRKVAMYIHLAGMPKTDSGMLANHMT
jgi:hypothetical protein